MIFCRHIWVREMVTYAPSYRLSSVVESMRGLDAAALLERSVHGVTTVLYRCEKCQELRKVEMLGAASAKDV